MDAKKLPSEIVTFCNRYGYQLEAAERYIENCGEWDKHLFMKSFCGVYSSVADFAHIEAEESGVLDVLPSYIRFNIDWAAVAQDMIDNADIWVSKAPGGTMFVFRNV